MVTITGGRFTLDLHDHTIAGKTSDDREGVVTVTGGQLRIENGTLENLCTGNGSKVQALTLLGTDTHVTLANVTAIGATPPNGDTSASVYAPDGARLTIESGEFTGRVAGTYASAPAETPHVSIAGGTFHNGLSYSIHETEANAATLLAILKEGYALAHADGTPVDLGTEPSFSPFSGTYTLSGEVQVVAHTHNVRSGRPGCCGCGYACPHDGQMPDSYFTLPVCSLCGVSYGTPLKDLRTPTGKIIIDENNWWQDFLNTVTFGLFFPTGARFTIEAADDSVDHAGYDPELYPVTVEYLVTDQRYTSDKIGDLADQFRPYPGKAVALPDDQTSIVYAKITDWAGNVTYLSTDDLTVDATAPEISSDVAENQIYCQDGLRIAFRDDHLKSVTLNGTEMTYAAEDGWYVLRLSAVSGSQEGQQTLTVTDEAGNGATVHFQWYAGHGFDDTGLCSHCGLQAEARWNDAFFPHLEDALTSADADEDGARFTAVVMLTNASLPADAFSLDGIRAVLALEGHTLTLSAPMTLEQSAGDLTIRDSTSSGKITGQALTVKGGRLTVEAGCFENTLNLQAYNVTLFGGTFARITSEDAAYPRAALPFRTAYQQADGQLIRRSDITPTLENVAVVSCPHDEIDGITCRICGTKMVAKVAKDDTLRYFAVFEDAAQYAAALEGSAITLLRDALWGSMGLPTGTYTLDLNGKTLSGSNDLMIDASLTICDSQGGGKLWRDGTILVLGGHVAISLQVTEQYRIDRTQPTGEIRVDERTAWQSFLSRITFGLFYREEQPVVITSADETSGVAATEYLLSAEDLDIPALEQETFLPYEKALALAPDGEYVVYARITDRAGNVTCLRSDGMVLDATAPAITGAENGGVYCAAVTLTITDAYPVTVTLNGAPVELTEGRLALRPAEGTQLVTATDPAGNESRLEITVNDGHTWGDWSSNGDDTHTRTCTISGCGALETESCTGGEATCVDRAVCEVCGGAYGDVDAHRHADLRHVEAKTATTEAPGNIEYWYCAACGKYFADAQASRELQQADTVTEKLPAAPTGDEAPLTLWVIVLAACAGLALLLLVLRRRNSHRTA